MILFMISLLAMKKLLRKQWRIFIKSRDLVKLVQSVLTEEIPPFKPTVRTVDPIIAYNNGETVVPLTEAGTRYFIYGRRGYCSMALHLRVPISAFQSAVARTSTSSTSPLPSSNTPNSHARPYGSNRKSTHPPP